MIALILFLLDSRVAPYGIIGSLYFSKLVFAAARAFCAAFGTP